MSWSNACLEAERRLKLLSLPESLHGLTIRLISFETDELAGLLVGGNSKEYQHMVNKAMRRLLQARGATIEIRAIKMSETMRWSRNGE